MLSFIDGLDGSPSTGYEMTVFFETDDLSAAGAGDPFAGLVAQYLERNYTDSFCYG